MTDEQMTALSGLLLKATGHRLEYYKKTVVARRVARRMGMLDARSVDEYIASLFKNTAETAHLVDDLMIGVTGFFRDPESWETLEKEVIRPLVLQEPLNRPLRVWAPACSTGEEAYTIAMAFQRQMERAGNSGPLNVFATDINEKALSHGRKGIYTARVTDGMPAEFMRRYFTRLGGGARARISKNVRDTVVFAKQNILTDPPFSRLDLIVCRNLFIYLEASVQEKLIGLFHYALKPGGFLFLGSAESIGRSCGFFKPLSGKNCKIYKRTGQEKPIGTAYSFNLSSARRDGARAGKTPLQCDKAIEAIAQKAMLEKFAPAAVVITASQDILYYNGPTADYLAQPGGAPTHNILNLVPENIRNRMRRLISRSVHENRPSMLSMAFAGNGKGGRKVFVEVQPLDRNLEAEPLFCIAFSEQNAKNTPTETIPDSCGSDEPLIRQLELELANTRDELLTNVEQEKSLNEELHSSNEELQAANEEMETSREELQTLNEELIASNSQLQHALAEQEKAEERLREREIKFRGIFENSNDAIIVLDAVTGAYIDCNPMAEKMSGYSREEIFSMKAGGLLTPLCKEEVAANMEALKSGKKLVGETELLAKNGAVVPTEFSSSMFAIGSKPCVLSILRDMGERRRAEAEIRSLAKFPSENPNPILRVGADGVVLFANEACAPLMRMWGCVSGDAVPRPWREKIRDLQATNTQETVEIPCEERIYSFSIVPVPDLGYVNWYGRDVTQRKEAEEALREAQKRTAAILEGIADTYYSLDNQWRFTVVNPAAERAPFARPAAELLGKVMWDMYPKLVGTPIHRHYLDAAGKHSLEHYTAQSPLNGRWYEVFMQGWKDGVDVYMRDITERKKVEEALALSNRKLTEVLESIQDDFYVLDRNWKFVFASRRFTSRIGKAPKDFMGNVIWEMFPMHVGTAFEQNLRATMENREIRRFEIGGKYTTAWYRMASFPSEEGVTVLGTDVTEQKRMEEALRQSEERFKAIAETTPVGIGVVGLPEAAFLYVNPAYENAFGYAKDEILGKGTPDIYWDQAERDAILAVLKKRGNVAQYEVRLKHKDGTMFWGIASVRPITFNGKAALLGSFTDITDRKKAEEAVNRQAEELRRGNEELERFNRIVVDRELRMLELKKEVNALLGLSGAPARYKTDFEKE